MKHIIALMTLWLITPYLHAGEVEIVDAKAHFIKASQSWNFSVTLKHDDTGWEHYANQWDVLSKEGEVLGTRVLYHPHVDEQPFTRNLSGVKISNTANSVFIQAQDTVHGISPNRLEIKLKK